MAQRIQPWVISVNLAYALILLALGLVPDLPEISRAVSDHAAHGLAYAVQAALLFVLLLGSVKKGNAAILAFAAASMYGAFVESLQLLQPARTVEIRDLAANIVGAGAAALALYFVSGRHKVVEDR